MQSNLRLLTLLINLGLVHAHMAAWHRGMYCLNGTTPGVDNENASEAVRPVYQLPKSEWWMHHNEKCDEFPPAPGDFIELPAGGSCTVEIAGNRGQTSLSYGGKYIANDLADDYSESPNCITSPNYHTQNKTTAAGTVFAISYQSDIKQVTAENLVVFTVKYHTPWNRLTSYNVPAALPACPDDGCHCVWGWVPNHCGQPNMYMHPYKCKVIGATSSAPLAPAQPPVWCEDDITKCVNGAKQMVFWNQADGNNVITEGYQRDGDEKSPGYNMKIGFLDGAQNDIS